MNILHKLLFSVKKFKSFEEEMVNKKSEYKYYIDSVLSEDGSLYTMRKEYTYSVVLSRVSLDPQFIKEETTLHDQIVGLIHLLGM